MSYTYLSTLSVGAYSMRSRVYVSVGCRSVCLSVCLSRRLTAAAACGWFAAECGRGRCVPAIDHTWRRPRLAANAGSIICELRRDAQHICYIRGVML